AFVANNPVNLNGYVSFSNNTGGAAAVFTGPATLTNNAFLNTANGSGPGSVTFGALGESGGARPPTLPHPRTPPHITTPNATTHPGGTYLVGGTLFVNNASSLGTGTVTFAGGGLAAFEKLTVNNAVSIPNTTAGFGGTNNLTLSGTVTVTGAATLTNANV